MTNTGVDISVVIPLFNKEPHIVRALRSVMAQRLPAREIIVVDDGSTDQGVKRAKEFAGPAIRLILQSNQGVSAARNVGILHSSCPLVAFLDADDEWHPDFLQEITLLAMRYPEAGAYCARYEMIAAGKPVRHAFAEVPTGEHGGIIRDYFLAALAWEPMSCSSVACRRELLQDLGGFPTGVAIGEDHFTWREIALRRPIAWCDRTLATHHLDAANRSGGRLYIGHIPIDCELWSRRTATYADYGNFPGLYDYEVKWRLKFIKQNWLAGQKRIVREMIQRSGSSRRYRLEILKWRLLNVLPTAIVKLLWKTKQVIHQRPSRLPAIRAIARVSDAAVPEHPLGHMADSLS